MTYCNNTERFPGHVIGSITTECQGQNVQPITAEVLIEHKHDLNALKQTDNTQCCPTGESTQFIIFYVHSTVHNNHANILSFQTAVFTCIPGRY